MDTAHKTALVTGANSGVGFEAAAQLAEDGWAKVILACRSIEKAEAARAQLVERVGRDPFGVLAVDTSEVASAQAACDELRDRGERVDFLLLNAGASSMSGSIEQGARRYLDAASFGDEDTGQFYATAHPKKVAGPMGIQDSPEHFRDTRGQEASFDAMVGLTGVAFPAAEGLRASV